VNLTRHEVHRAYRAIAVLVLHLAAANPAGAAPPQATQPPQAQLKVFLDCGNCFSDFLRAEVTFVDYVRDRNEADVHVIITSIETGGAGREYTAAFTGLRAFQGVTHLLKAVTTTSDSEDVIRRQLATTLRVGLLHFMTREGVSQHLAVDVELAEGRPGLDAPADRWNKWVFSFRGDTSFEGEESSRERRFGGSASADRVTADWKITVGANFNEEREEFDLDEDAPVAVERRERELSWLVVKALGEHWSAGTGGELESSTFSNTSFQGEFAGAIEFNVFPYSAYTKRQLRTQYLLGVRHAKYNEETLFGLTRETRGRQEISSTFEQRERWGSIEAEIEFSQYLHDLGKYRLETNGEVSLRIARGFSVSADLRASRIRDQISLPRRGATPEEILLRLRQLQSGYEYDFRVGVTYTFGSIFSAIVNPRFGS
jgi:hypothetical protein